MLKPSTYTHLLQDADCVIHSSGILLEADYKGVLQGKESPIAGLRRAYSATKMGSARNPLEKGEGGDGAEEELKPGEGDGQLTYELMNRDTGMFFISRSPHSKYHPPPPTSPTRVCRNKS